MGLSFFEPFGAFYVFPCIKEFGMTSDEFANKLLQSKKVAVVPGTAFGASGEGLIVPPSPDVTDLGHKNGVPVIGTVFFPQGVAGGKMEWLDTFLSQEKDGSFPLADKLIEVAKIYGFDGWFINQETEGTEEQPLTKDYADQMQAFIKYFKEKAPELRVIYYDSMTADGEMDWQNALTDQNEMDRRRTGGSETSGTIC